MPLPPSFHRAKGIMGLGLSAALWALVIIAASRGDAFPAVRVLAAGALAGALGSALAASLAIALAPRRAPLLYLGLNVLFLGVTAALCALAPSGSLLSGIAADDLAPRSAELAIAAAAGYLSGSLLVEARRSFRRARTG